MAPAEHHSQSLREYYGSLAHIIHSITRFDQIQFTITNIWIVVDWQVGSVIGGVSAVDDDVGLNSRIRYMIRPDPAGHHKWFRVDNVTGVLTLGRPLDREKQKFYQVFK